MNIDPNAPSRPTNGKPKHPNKEWAEASDGLTIRTELAARMMAGFAACSYIGAGTIEDYAEYAVRWADALIIELNKPTP
jgi:hypothetical protein